jgi:carboxyl-terminal processing protease
MSKLSSMSENEPNKRQISLPLILCLGLAGGILIGANLSGKQGPDKEILREVQKFREVLTLIKNEYVGEVNTDVMVEEAITNMLTKLDPHSSYISASDRIAANEDLKGNFEGIGIEFNIFQDTIVVVAPINGGPSESVGIRSGDKIIEVNGEDIAGVGVTTTDVQKALKGPKGSEVEVTVLRKGVKEPIVFNIIRDKIPQYSLDVAYMVNSEIGYIKISRFSQTTYKEFVDAMHKLRSQGMQKLVLDLQGNPGGYMSQAIDMADEFLGSNKKIVYTKGKDRKYNSDAKATKKGQFEEGDLIILVNEGSASASEILAGALQDNDRALIVGRRTFGKGLVQAPFELNDGAELRLTISKYYTPSGRSIQKPYQNGAEYAHDIISRYNHGEFFHADSIKLNDSLRYVTNSGRAVYGGGGIMPDYFVPLDTSLNTQYLNELYTSSAMQEYTFNYTDANREKLEQMGYEKFYKSFKVSDQMINELVETGKRYKVKPDYKALRDKRKLFELHVKAQIARKIWNNDGFYPLFNETNEILQQAIKLFDKVPDLNRSTL